MGVGRMSRPKTGADPHPPTHTHTLPTPLGLLPDTACRRPSGHAGCHLAMQEASASCPIHLSSALHSGPITIKGPTCSCHLARMDRGPGWGHWGMGRERICIRRMGSNLLGTPGIRKAWKGTDWGLDSGWTLEVEGPQLEARVLDLWLWARLAISMARLFTP